MKQKETKFKEKVQKDLKKLKNAWWFKSQEVAIRGIPDIIMCINGHFVSLELKRSNKAKIDKLQYYNAEKIEGAGGVALIVSPEWWWETFAFLKRIDAGENPQRIKLKLP